MKNIVIAGIVGLSPFITLIADGNVNPPPLVSIHEHRVNFGLLNLSYERIQPDSIYTGIETKFSSFLLNEKDKSKSVNHYLNGEIKLGYNHQLTEVDSITGYGGVGFSAFSVENKEGKLRNWNFATIGVKYLHQFGEIFEMGLHMKGFRSISQKRYAHQKVKDIDAEIPKVIEEEGSLPRIEMIRFQSEKDHGKTNLTAVKVNDTRFVVQIGIPMIWHVGANKNWEIQFEPYYMQIPNVDLTHIIGSNVGIGYRY